MIENEECQDNEDINEINKALRLLAAPKAKNKNLGHGKSYSRARKKAIIYNFAKNKLERLEKEKMLVKKFIAQKNK